MSNLKNCIEWIKSNNIKHFSILNENGKQISVFEAEQNDSLPEKDITDRFEKVCSILEPGKYTIKGREFYKIKRKTSQFDLLLFSEAIAPVKVHQNTSFNDFEEILENQEKLHKLRLKQLEELTVLNQGSDNSNSWLDKFEKVTANVLAIFEKASESPVKNIQINKDANANPGEVSELEKVISDAVGKIINAGGSDAVRFLQVLASKNPLFIRESLKIVLPILEKA